jgi:hypothetical protein
MAFFAGQEATAAALNGASGVQTAGGIVRVTNATATSGTVESAWATTGTLALAASTTYEVTAKLYYGGSVSGDGFFFRLRLTNVAGTQLQVIVLPLIATSGGGPYEAEIVYTFTTSVAVNDIFCATLVRNSGTGTAQALAGSKISVRSEGGSSVYSTV